MFVSLITAVLGAMFWILFDDSSGFLLLILGLGGVLAFGSMDMMSGENMVWIRYNAANEISVNTELMDVSKIVQLDVVERLEMWDECIPIKTIDYPKRNTEYLVSVRPGSVIEVYATYLSGERKLVSTTSSSFGTTITGAQVSSPRGNIVDVQEYNKNRKPVITDITWNGGIHYA